MRGPGDDATGVAPTSPAAREAWQRTNDDMDAIAEERREDDWEVVAAPAVHTDTLGREQGSEDYFGLIHVVPDNHADAVADAFERGEFDRFEAYRNEVDGYGFLVTELLDDERRLALLLAGCYDLRRARTLLATVREEDVCYTHAKTLDGTHLGSVRHDEWEPLLAEAAVDETTPVGADGPDPEND